MFEKLALTLRNLIKGTVSYSSPCVTWTRLPDGTTIMETRKKYAKFPERIVYPASSRHSERTLRLGSTVHKEL